MDPITIAMGLAQFAPAVIKYLTGSDKAEEVAGKVVEVAQAVTGKATPDEAASALQADPALQLQFRQAVMANELEWERLFLADIDGARKRDTAIMTATGHNRRADILAGLACMTVILCLVIVVWASGINEFAKGTITLILGRALGWVEQIFSFEFGTTRSARVKDDTISKLSGK